MSAQPTLFDEERTETTVPTNSAYISPDGVYRYSLARTWDTSLPMLGLCGLNPSTKRAIIEEHETIRSAYPGSTIEDDPCCFACSAGGEYPGRFPCRTLLALAAPYSDHGDFRPEWSVQ